jgi:hypothetical protein
MHPNGQLPAYEWALNNVNPPVHAWAALQVYQITHQIAGHKDSQFLERIFHKLLLNFTSWVNRKDHHGNNIFQGGFLGLDNIGVFDRSRPLPTGGHLEQADGTAWMAMYCLNMLAIALELARTNPAYEDIATKFFEHFIYIANALYDLGGSGHSLWDEEEGFFYDLLHLPDGSYHPLKVRSMVGLIPLLAIETLEPETLENLPKFRRRMAWFLEYRPHLVERVASLTELGAHKHHQLAIMGRNKIERILERMLDPAEFLSDYGLRSLSRYHADHPYHFKINQTTYSVRYEPGESTTDLFGGNSNWRGPIWFPINFLIIDALRKYHHHYGNSLKVEFPSGSKRKHSLAEVADALSRRLISIFSVSEKDNKRPVFGEEPIFQTDPHWKDYPLFFEYFHGEHGTGLGASHQTGWTALVTKLIQDSGGFR